jgi:arsenate reductase (glutaredoxin)
MSDPEAFLVYHNPSCGKSRRALAILRDEGVETQVVEYLKQPPARAELERIVAAIPDEPSALVRNDKRFAELELDATDYRTREQVVDLLVEHPELMERPVVFRGDRALICRPSERVRELLD